LAVALLVMKVLLAPTLLATCSLVTWRWGAAVGGWLLGLPLISGPVSVLLFLEHGERFAESAARGTLLGLLATGAFCVWYSALARRTRWWLTLPLAYGACLTVAWGLSFVHVPLAWVAAIVAAGLGVLSAGSRPTVCGPVRRTGAAALLLKMAAAAVMVVAITMGAGLLGPSVAGLLAPLPVLLALMAASSHRREGFEAARGLLHGALAGSWGGAAFFTVLALALGPLSPLAAYATALAAALVVAAMSTRLREAAPSGAWVWAAWRSLGVAMRRERHLPRVRFPRPALLWMLRG
jgi:hypothetical protein